MKTSHGSPGVLGARLLSRRLELGLRREDVAQRADVDVGYVAYLEEQGGEPSSPVLQRLAAVLRTTAEMLTRSGGPPGARQLDTLDEDECWVLLAATPIGRIAFAPGSGPPVVHPVNYVVLDRRLAIRTGEQTQLAYVARAFRRVTFEVDRIDEEQQTGWSVLVTGAAHLASPHEKAQLHVDELVDPWAGGDRPAVVVIRPDRITGRRIAPASVDVREG